MSRAAWRVVLALPKGNLYHLTLFFLLAVQQTDMWVGSSFRKGVQPTILAGIWFAFAVTWPIPLSILPSFRQLLLLPLTARDAGGLMVLLRVGLPTLCLVGSQTLWAFATSGPLCSPARIVNTLCLTLSLSAAFPLMTLVPFLPLPVSAWRMQNDYPPSGHGVRRMRLFAAAAVWLGAPAIAVLPFLTLRHGVFQGTLISVSIGVVLTALAWRWREQLVVVSFQSDRATSGSSGALARPAWRGWAGFVPLVLPSFRWQVVVSAATQAFAMTTWHSHGAPSFVQHSMLVMLPAILVALGFVLIVDSARALRMLPIAPAALSLVLLALLVVPAVLSNLGALATLALAPHAAIYTPRDAALWFLCIVAYAICLAPSIKLAHLRWQGALLCGVMLLQACVLVPLYAAGAALPPAGWLLAAAAVLLGGSFVWLRHTLRTTIPRAMVTA
jgi:hypothetical protein